MMHVDAEVGMFGIIYGMRHDIDRRPQGLVGILCGTVHDADRLPEGTQKAGSVLY
jgi:hypothetical protein